MMQFQGSEESEKQVSKLRCQWILVDLVECSRLITLAKPFVFSYPVNLWKVNAQLICVFCDAFFASLSLVSCISSVITAFPVIHPQPDRK